MEFLQQRHWHLSARLEGKELVSEVTYCGTDRELTARMLVDPKSLQVLKACWEVYRAPGFTAPKIRDLPLMKGVQAYFGCGKQLREALSFLNDPYAVNLFSEGVRAIIQAETFLYQERGYSSAAEYEQNWNVAYNGACRYYSNLDRVSREWYEHVGYDQRSGNLFNRLKSQTLARDNGRYILTGHLNDSFHGVAVELTLDEKATVKKSEGTFLRVPDPVCGEALCYLQELEGKVITALTKKDIAHLLGSGQGCVHIIDLVADGMETFQLFLDEK